MQKDYILRMIEQFIQALIGIIQRRKAGQYKEALIDIQSASSNYLRIDIDTLINYSPEQIVDYFSDSSKHLDAERCILCADLLYELALIFEEKKQLEMAVHIRKSCLYLYKTAIPKEPKYQIPHYFDRISSL